MAAEGLMLLEWHDLATCRPTESDADLYGCVMVYDQNNGLRITGWQNSQELNRGPVTHWAHTPDGPGKGDMKLNKIKALCKAKSSVILYKMPNGRQYISDGAGIYPVDSTIKLTEEMIRVVFEVSPKRWKADWYYEEYNGPDEIDIESDMLSDTEREDEVPLMLCDTRIVYCGTQLMRFETSDGGIVWAPAAQFAPLDGAERYGLRIDGECRVVAAYNSPLCCGVVHTVGRKYAEQVHDELLGMISGEYI